MLDFEGNDKVDIRNIKYFMRKVARINVSSEETEAMVEYAAANGKEIDFTEF